MVHVHVHERDADVPAGAPAGIFRKRPERPVPLTPGIDLAALVPGPGRRVQRIEAKV
ncbi:hypothetical protein [Kitasatospora sp. NPDC015120]|uniref:hypothetical protein n=1 Tax=Kitasatospora sp. NPDC015120 TaxID=3364023 RepID=UPI0036F479B8